MNIKQYALLCASIAALSGCGSDDSASGAQRVDPMPVVEVTKEGWNYVETPYFDIKGFELKGGISVFIGRQNDNVALWLSEPYKLLADPLNPDPAAFAYNVLPDANINGRDAAAAGIVNTEDGEAYPHEKPAIYRQEVQEMIDYLAKNPDGLGAGTARPDIFKPGHYSVFDLLRFLVGTRSDLRWEGGVESIIKPEDSEYDTYEFRLSWDYNGDGQFDEGDNLDYDNDGVDDIKYFNSENWHFGAMASVGQNKQFGDKAHTQNYMRMDSYWLREDQSVRFLAHHDVMTKRRQWLLKTEVDRLAANDGKYIVPLVMHFDALTDRFNAVPSVEGQNIEVKAWNMRSDVFQEGTILSMDIWLSYAEATSADIRYTWWPVMSSGALANSFAMMHNPWTGNYGGWYGAAPFRGELVAQQDFHYATPQCYFNKDGITPMNPNGTPAPLTDPVDPDVCKREWIAYQADGGNTLGEMDGVLVHTYPPQFVGLVTFDGTIVRNSNDIDLHRDHKIEVYVAEDELQLTILNNLGDFSDSGDGSVAYPTYDVENPLRPATLRFISAATEENRSGNAKILDETHFGWKIADCAQCHNEDKQPLGHGGQNWPTNTADGFDYVQPHYCASCHGNNGAPEQHNRGARCFWCHNTYNGEGVLMKNHGDASLAKFIPKEKNVANKRTASGAPVNSTGNLELYDDLWYPSHNSDYTLSRKFPGPYSCGTCHGFEQELKQQTNN